SFWPPPQVGEADGGHGGGETSRLAVIDPFLPLLNVPVALTGPPTVTLLAAFGHFPPLFTQVQVALPVSLSSSSMLTLSPIPASFQLTTRSPFCTMTALVCELMK